MTQLETMRDRLNEQLVAVKANLDNMTALRDAMEAEISRVPTMEDLKALVTRIP